MSDSIIKEVRRVREQHAAGMSYDLDRIYDDLKAGERKHAAEGWAVVPPPPVPPQEPDLALQRTALLVDNQAGKRPDVLRQVFG